MRPLRARGEMEDKKDLQEIREEIDAIDDELCDLFSKRMDLALAMARYKKDHDLPVLDQIRENQVLARVTERLGEPLDRYGRILFNSMFDVSRTYQQNCMDLTSEIRTGYGLIGEKLEHSFSKTIHELIGAYEYDLIPLSREKLDLFLKNRNFRGLNVTIPYKKTVMAYCDRISPLAEKLGAVNTLYFDKDGALCGTNTDYPGFLKAAAAAGITFKDRKVLILGDGGAGGTVRHAVKDSGAASVTVVTRHPEDSPAKNQFDCISYDQLKEHSDSEIIINATPVGMYPNNGERLISLADFPECKGVFDTIYNPYLSALLLQAKKAGIPYANGLSMLVSQATEAAAYFTGKDGWDEKDAELLAALREKSMNIVLIGMPGSGKSTIGRALSVLTGKTFVDTDDLVEDMSGMTIPEIFARHGESHFRDLESKIARRIGKETRLIIATGGGCVLREENMDALMQNGRIVLLERDTEKLATAGRPLSTDLDALRKIKEDRSPLYKKYGEFTIDTGACSPKENAELICEKLRTGE